MTAGNVDEVVDPRKYVMVSLGRSNGTTDEAWLVSGFVRQIVRFEQATPSGYRFRSRGLGLGLDSAAAAVRACLTAPRGPFLASNPWVGVALRLTGRRDVAVTGIYAEPGTRSHRLLWRFLSKSPVVTLLDQEAESWNELGGHAKAVLYGNTFGYSTPAAHKAGLLRVFVGGMSDRDPDAVAQLEAEVRRSKLPIHLTITSREEPSVWTNGISSIERTGWISADEFGIRLGASDVVFLPLRVGNRAAGHMVAIGALEAGTPVLTTMSPGMNGYVDGEHITYLQGDRGTLDQLAELAHAWEGRRDGLRSFWRREFSLPAYVARVGGALAELSKGHTQ